MVQRRSGAALLLVALALAVPPPARPAPQDPESVRKWQEDLGYFRQKLIAVHPEPFHSLSEGDLDRMLTDLRADLPRLTENQVIIRISKILASLGQGDGHSGLRLGDARFGFHIVPLGFYWFTTECSSRRRARAVAIFELNAEAFPGSWNVWDSLGEALASAGRRDEAIRCYERALELDPGAGPRVRSGSSAAC